MIDPFWSAMAVASEATEPTLAETEASIGAATLAFAATAPSIGAASLASAAALTLMLSRLPLSADVGLGAVAVARRWPARQPSPARRRRPRALVWSMALCCGAWAMAEPDSPWSMFTPW